MVEAKGVSNPVRARPRGAKLLIASIMGKAPKQGKHYEQSTKVRQFERGKNPAKAKHGLEASRAEKTLGMQPLGSLRPSGVA
jgi:hypothetical protein